MRLPPSTLPWPGQLAGLLGWLLLTYLAATVGAIASASAATFYAQLLRPAWAPPGWLFAPVWSSLYTLMALSAWLVWRAGGFQAARPALLLFAAQLVWNALWSWLFFVWRLGALAGLAALLLWALVLATSLAFARVNRAASALLWPYLAWVAFAVALTFSVWRLNPGLLA